MKYILVSGKVQSANDDQYHYISSQRLRELYGINKSRCIFVKNMSEAIRILNGRDDIAAILFPKRRWILYTYAR